MMEKSETIGKLAEALSKAQAVIETASKDSENPFYKSVYADLSSVWNVARKPLSDNGLSISQLPGSSEGNKVRLHTILMHSSGEWVSSDFEMPYLKADPQAVGSALSYARRYALSSIVGIVADVDDDGNAATGKGKEEPVKPAHPPQNKPPQATGQKHTIAEMQDGIVTMLADMYGNGQYEDELVRMTTWKKADGSEVPGKASVYDLNTKTNDKGASQLSITYGKVKAEWTKWTEAMKEGA